MQSTFAVLCSHLWCVWLYHNPTLSPKWHNIWERVHHHHHHHVPEGLGMLSCSLILKMKVVPPSLPRSSYVSSPFWFIL